MEAILEADPYLTRPSPRDISGQICKGKHKSMRRSAINALKCDQCVKCYEISNGKAATTTLNALQLTLWPH